MRRQWQTARLLPSPRRRDKVSFLPKLTVKQCHDLATLLVMPFYTLTGLKKGDLPFVQNYDPGYLYDGFPLKVLPVLQ